MTQRYRALVRVIESQATSDGAGVKLRRSLGSSGFARLDPFLMLDEFFSDDPDDYLAGFPAHPHRGFETVTYMLEGRMQHTDHLGNSGDLGPGSVQWMTAGRGVIHSEMPQQSEGRMRGFQLWLNLPAAAKMKPAAYRDIAAADVPEMDFAGGRARVIAGTLAVDGAEQAGAVNAVPGGMATDPLLVDLHLAPNSRVDIPIAAGYNALLYVYDGELSVDGRPVPYRSAGVLGDGDSVVLIAGGDGGRALLIAGRPIGEPVVQYGPFVMNSREEIEQAMADYRAGRLTEPA
ncbi:pirin family protein [Wenzhouxiangella limi]|uniref:Pirin family protein n=1 Tax=Wenzhouxiangella limi TaxID=2707351 RepID=A0A845UZA5_9GAMM|nr:pirin family protein [Wenzhouxiangella limi]NDY95622.1 pirin family protein [Wenzhouxiangella limi]